MIDCLFLLLAAPTAAFWLFALAATLYMVRTIPVLEQMRLEQGTRPSVTVVSPACNEQDHIEPALRSWLAQEDLDLQIVAVNDRSTDETGAIIDRLATEDRRVVATHVHDLEDGWLGKVHALHHGVQHATGDWLLFSDADVRLESGTVARAVAFAEARTVDLLTAYPEIESAGFIGDVAWNVIGATAGPGRLWRTRDPASDRAFGVGAFILVRRSAFQQTPGFRWLKLELADDQGLAILLKAHGHRCDIVNGRGLVRLTWYTSFTDMRQKSQKNWFGILGRFSVVRCWVIASACVASALSPLAVFLPDVSPLLLPIPLMGIVALWMTALIQARWARRPMWPVLFAPLGVLLLAYLVARAGLIGQRLGGIEWRGIVYPSARLRGVQRFKM